MSAALTGLPGKNKHVLSTFERLNTGLGGSDRLEQYIGDVGPRSSSKEQVNTSGVLYNCGVDN